MGSKPDEKANFDNEYITDAISPRRRITLPPAGDQAWEHVREGARRLLHSCPTLFEDEDKFLRELERSWFSDPRGRAM